MIPTLSDDISIKKPLHHRFSFEAVEIAPFDYPMVLYNGPMFCVQHMGINTQVRDWYPFVDQ
jgi:hypothetical protein